MSTKHLLGPLILGLGLDRLIRRLCARRRVTIAIYHDPEPDVLRTHLAYYARHYRFVTLDDVAEALESKRWDRLPDYPLVVTIDDGHRGNLELGTLLRHYGIRPTIYLCSRVVGTARPYWWKTPAARKLGPESLKRLPDAERRRRLAEAGSDPDADAPHPQAMTWEEADAFAAIADYGGHTRHHPILPRCGDAEAADEIGTCRDEVEAALGRPCRHFAYPNGDYGPREIALLRRFGYRTGRTVEPGWNGPDADPYQLKGFPISDDASVSWLAVQLTGLPAALRTLKASWRRKATDKQASAGITMANPS